MQILEKNSNFKEGGVKKPLYHGHTVIELKDVHNGKRDRIEHANTFTTGIEDYLRGSGEYNNYPWNNSTWAGYPLYRTLTGGILLFNKEIDESSTIMPAGTKMTANGSYGVSNNEDPKEMGSFNSSESSFTKNAITYVYDWTTSNGNGDIGCVCLTSDIGGYIGYGNCVSNSRHASGKDISENQAGRNIMLDTMNDFMISCGYLYGVNAKSNNRSIESITFTRKSINIDTASLFEDKETITVDIPDQIKTEFNGKNVSVFCGEGKIIIIEKNIEKGGQKTIGIYDVENESWSQVRFQSERTNFSIDNTRTSILSKHVYLSENGNDNGILIDLTNGNTEDKNYGLYITEIGEGLCLSRKSEDYGSLSSGLAIVDMKSDTVYPINAFVARSFVFKKIQDNRMLYMNINSEGTRIYRNPLYLATVNNLDSVVTKTADKTMKVTYTVTRVE